MKLVDEPLHSLSASAKDKGAIRCSNPPAFSALLMQKDTVGKMGRTGQLHSVVASPEKWFYCEDVRFQQWWAALAR